MLYHWICCENWMITLMTDMLYEYIHSLISSFLSVPLYHTYITILVQFFCIVQHLSYVLSVVVSGTFAPSACILSSAAHHSPPVLHPSVFFLWLLPPSLFRSAEQWAYGDWAIWSRPAVPPPPLIPPQTPSHRTAGCQRQVNIQRNKGQTC